MPGTRGPVPEPKHAGAGDLTRDILLALDHADEPIHTQHTFRDVPQPDIKAALDRLASRAMLLYDTRDTEQVVLTEDGERIVREGSHEFRVWEAVREAGRVEVKALLQAVPPGTDIKIGQGNAFKAKWIKKDGDSLVPLTDSVKDTTRDTLRHLHTVTNPATSPDAKTFQEYRKRQLVRTAKSFSYTVRKGPKFALELPVEVTDLTAEMLESGAWQTAAFKPYNFAALGATQHAGALHPLNKVREEFRKIFFNADFVEMPTSRYVDSGFWNFDALFVPQQHPARDLQDTFYVADPAEAGPPGPDPVADAALDAMEADSFAAAASSSTPTLALDYSQYYANVAAVHQSGAFGSIGYRYPFSPTEPRRLLLRTHTTATSTYVLHRLAAHPRPARYFSIDRVFRNETVDATHLAEFHQIEGVIADYGLTLGGLMEFLERFFAKLGIFKLRFKPAYNPYTEPSMEVFGFHPGLARWVEIGNSGMFRPEMLQAMGLPPALRVYGFGLSLERPTMIKYGVSNIRELLGHKVDLGFVESNAAVRLDRD